MLWEWVDTYARTILVITQLMSVVLLLIVNVVILWGLVRLSRATRAHARESREGFTKLLRTGR